MRSIPRRTGPTSPANVALDGLQRELEDLRSAVNLAIADKLCREAVNLRLPPKPAPRKDYLER